MALDILLNATNEEATAPTGDASFYSELASATTRNIDFRYDKESTSRSVRRGLAKTCDALSVVTPVAPLRRLAMRTGRSLLTPSQPRGPSTIVLSHIHCPRLRDGSRLIWSSQGISTRDYYEIADGKVTLDDVIALYQRLGDRADSLLVWCESGASRLADHCPSLAARIRVVHPPVLDSSHEGGIGGDVPAIVFVGTDPARKGLDTLIAAFPRVRRELPTTELRILGVPASRSAPDGVSFLGRCARREVVNAMASADVLVLPSRAETYGLTVVEAMMMGLAVVVSDVEPLPEVAGSEISVVPVDQPNALAERLIELFRDSALLSAEKRRCRALYETRNATHVFLTALDALCRDLA